MGLEQAQGGIDAATYSAIDLAAREVPKPNDMLQTIDVLRNFDLSGFVGRLRNNNYRLDGVSDIGEVRNKKGKIVINGVTPSKLADVLERFSTSPLIMSDSDLTNLKDETLFSSPAELAYTVIDASMRMAGINEATVAHNKQKGWHFAGEDVWAFGQILKQSLSTGTPLDYEQVREYATRISGVKIGRTVTVGSLLVLLVGCTAVPEGVLNTPVVVEVTPGEAVVVEAGTVVVTDPAAEAPSEEAPAEAPPTMEAQPTESAIVSIETPALTGPLEFTAVVPYTEVLHWDDIVDLNSAKAIYAFFRAEGRLWEPSGDAEFIAGMSEWAKELEDVPALKAQKISIIRSVGSSGTPVTMLVKGDGENQQVLLDFFIDNDMLRSASPGGVSPDSVSKWINVNGRAGLVVGPDGVGYVTQMEGTDVVGYLNPYGASLDNIHSHWIPVEDGVPAEFWDGTEWVKVESEVKPWSEVRPVLNLSPESDLVVKLNSVSLDTGVTKRFEEGNKILQLGKVGYLADVVEYQITPGAVAIVLVTVEKQPDGSYRQVDYVAGIDRGLANGGVGITQNTSNDFREAFWNSEKLAFNPITSADLLAYYKAQVGDRVNHIAPRWNAEANAFDPAVFARQVARQTAAGTSENPIYKVIPDFLIDYSKPGVPCNTGDELLFPQSILEFD